VRIGTRQLRLGPGDTMLLYTDGVTEARHGDDLFGEPRLAGLLAGAPPDAEAIADRVVDAVTRFGDGRTADALALVALRVTERGELRHTAG
jgi:phosphoserine phosphatase RsbU/P